MKLLHPFLSILLTLFLLQGCQGASEPETTALDDAKTTETDAEATEPEASSTEEESSTEQKPSEEQEPSTEQESAEEQEPSEEETSNNDGFTIHENNRVVSLNLGQEAYNAWVNNDYFYNDFSKVKPVMTRIYEKFNDNFDFIFFVLNEDMTPDSIPYSGLNISGINTIEGIGKYIQPRTSSTFGSSNKLQSTMQLTSRNAMRNGPTLHELMHNWGNNVIDSFYVKSNGEESRSGGHWGFSSVGGQLGGFELSTLQENVDGNASKYQAHYGNRSNFGYNANGGNSLPYSELELYLMGLLPSSDVPDTIVFKGLSQTREEYFRGIFHATSKEIISVNDIIEKYGERNPTYLNSQTEFKLLTIVLTGSELTDSQWKKVDDDVKWFSDILETDENTRLYNFYQATRSQATINAEVSNDDIR